LIAQLICRSSIVGFFLDHLSEPYDESPGFVMIRRSRHASAHRTAKES